MVEILRASHVLDPRAIGLREIADLRRGIGGKAQARLGRQPPGAGVRRIDEAELLQVVLHHIADRGGRRQRHGQDPREMARANRVTDLQIKSTMRRKISRDRASSAARALLSVGRSLELMGSK